MGGKMEPKCGKELHQTLRAEIGRCSGDLMVCVDYYSKAKWKRSRNLYRCEGHAFKILSHSHKKYLKFNYVVINEKPKITKTEKLINNFLRELESKGETNMKCYWKVENGFITGTLCLEAGTAEEREILDGLKNRFGERVHPIADAPNTIDEKPKKRRGRPRKVDALLDLADEGAKIFEEHGVKTGTPTVEVVRGSKKIKVIKAGDKPKKKRGRPRGSKNKPKSDE